MPKNNRSVSGFLGLVAVVLLAFGCSGEKPPAQDNDEVVRANELITSGDYSEAIYIMKEHLQADPADTHARVILASAYAARAGLMLTKYTDFADKIVGWGNVDNLLPDATGDDSPVLKALASVANTVVKMELVVQAFDTLPTPTTPQAQDDLNQAVQALDDAGPITGGPVLYRALLKTVVLKIDLLGKYRLTTTVACAVATGALATWFGNVDDEVQSILADVAASLADPGSAQNVTAKAADIKNGVTQVQTVLATPDLAAQSLELSPSVFKDLGVCQ